MPGYQQIETSQPAAFSAAAQQFQLLADGTVAASEQFDSAVQPRLRSDVWHGDSRDAAADAAKRTGDPLGELSQQVRSAAYPIADVARAGEAGQEQLLALSGEATAAGYAVEPTGMVLLGPAQLSEIAAAGPAAPGIAETYQLGAIGFTEDIWAVMTWVSGADVAAGERLMALCAQHGGPALLPLSPVADEHILYGEWNNAGTRPVGYHSRPGGTDAGNPHGFTLLPGTSTTPDGQGLYAARFEGLSPTGTLVQKRSTYFPDTWSHDDARRAVAGAFHARHPVYEWVPPTPANPAGRFREVPGMWEGEYQGVQLRGYLLNSGEPGYRGRTIADAELEDVKTGFPVRLGDFSYGQR